MYLELNKSRSVYIADTLPKKYGHQVLRLPPYHCISNLIEHIWSITIKIAWVLASSSAEKSLTMLKEHTEEKIQRWWDRKVGFDREDG